WSTSVIRTLTYPGGCAQGIRASSQFDRSRAKLRANCIQLPLAQNEIRDVAPALNWWCYVNSVSDEGVSPVEIRVALIRSEVEGIARRISESGKRNISDGVSPGIRNLKRQV